MSCKSYSAVASWTRRDHLASATSGPSSWDSRGMDDETNLRARLTDAMRELLLRVRMDGLSLVGMGRRLSETPHGESRTSWTTSGIGSGFASCDSPKLLGLSTGWSWRPRHIGQLSDCAPDDRSFLSFHPRLPTSFQSGPTSNSIRILGQARPKSSESGSQLDSPISPIDAALANITQSGDVAVSLRKAIRGRVVRKWVPRVWGL